MHEVRTGSADGARADFEQMLAQLASATNPNVRMIAVNPGDWGIDAFAGDLGGAITAWQSKYFMPKTTTNQSQQIRESLTNALKAAAVIARVGHLGHLGQPLQQTGELPVPGLGTITKLVKGRPDRR
ncbi:hypothetical protein ACFWPV_30955 [Streptomyces uncialis]|uniref:hypothetical protein n=1 Tax=Streptomyces uncialis TaxID=1048205 RepID=UPI00365032B1